jgi:rRNA maturation endonuclease Nob1
VLKNNEKRIIKYKTTTIGVNIVERDKVFCMDESGCAKRIDEYSFKFCPFCGSNLHSLILLLHLHTTISEC